MYTPRRSTTAASAAAGTTRRRGSLACAVIRTSLGRPCAMPRNAVAMPTKMTARSIRYAIATPARPWSSAALRIVSSLRNGPNGGDPVSANRPIAQRIPRAEGGLTRRRAHLLDPDDAEEGAVQQRAGEQRRDDGGRFAVRVGEPRVQRSQTHLGAVADQEEKERRLEPHDPEPGCARDQV